MTKMGIHIEGYLAKVRRSQGYAPKSVRYNGQDHLITNDGSEAVQIAHIVSTGNSALDMTIGTMVDQWSTHFKCDPSISIAEDGKIVIRKRE